MGTFITWGEGLGEGLGRGRVEGAGLLPAASWGSTYSSGAADKELSYPPASR